MRNNKGYSIVLVLLILGVLSLLGSALMIMTRTDLNFTGAVKNYDKLFNLADGACGIAYNDIRLSDREPRNYRGTGSIRIGPFYQLSEQPIGNYSVYEVFQGFDDSARRQSGFEAGSGSGSEGYHMLFWTGEGQAARYLGLGTLMVESALLKHKRD
jgi:hypothetical protein